MASALTTQTAGGNIRYAAGTSIALSALNAGTGKVSLVTGTGSITDQNAASLNVTASQLRIESGGAVATGADALEITVDTLAAQSVNGMFFSEASALTIGTVSVAVDYLNANLSTTTVTDASLSGLVTSSNGAIVLVTANGTLTVAQVVTANGTGNVLLQAQTTAGNDKDVLLNAAASSGTGNISVIANNSVTQAAAGDLTTVGGTVDVEAQNGLITMANGAVASSGGGSIRYLAAQSVVLGGLNAVAGTVEVTATAGSITDGGIADLEVIAGTLRLDSSTGIGTSANALDISVATLAVRTEGSIYLEESDEVTVGSVAGVQVQRVAAAGTTAAWPVFAVATAGLTTTANGNIVLYTLNGSLTVDQPVSVTGNGNVRLETRAATVNDKDVFLNAPV
ncbi:MAG: hypothetical protein AAB263_13100, partial [Planctomycetota bacterium]